MIRAAAFVNQSPVIWFQGSAIVQRLIVQVKNKFSFLNPSSKFIEIFITIQPY